MIAHALQGNMVDEKLLRAMLLWAGMLRDGAMLQDVWQRVQALEGPQHPLTLAQYTASTAWCAAHQAQRGFVC